MHHRPLFRNKGLKHRRYELKALEGMAVRNQAFMAKIYDAIEKLTAKYLEK